MNKLGWSLALTVGVLGLLSAQERSPGFAKDLDAAYRSLLVAPEFRQAAFEKALSQMPSWDPDSLVPDDRLDYDGFSAWVGANLDQLRHPILEVPYPLPTPFVHPAVFLLTNYQPLSGVGDVDAWMAALAAVPDQLAKAVATLQARETQGVHYPRIVLTQVSRSLENAAFGPAANGELAGFFRSRIADPSDRKRVVALLEDKVYPAYKAAKKAIDELATRAPSTYSLAGTPKDPAPYQALIVAYLGESVPAAVLHGQALADLERLNAEADSLVPGPGPAYERVRGFLRAEPLLSSEDLDWAGQLLTDTKAWASQLTSLPIPEFEVRFQTSNPVPNYIRPSLDGLRPAHLNLSRGTLVKGVGAASLLWHEGIPGHALQLGVQLADDSRPAYRSEAWPPAFTEGWATYAEHAMVDSPWGASPYYRAFLWAAQYSQAVLVALDTGINGLGWTYKDAQSFLFRTEPGDSRGFDGQINRMIYWPGQTLSYWYGFHQIVALRDEIRQGEGTAFDLRQFHDRLLTLGAQPFPLIRRALFSTLSP